jgi:ribosomal protein L13
MLSVLNALGQIIDAENETQSRLSSRIAELTRAAREAKEDFDASCTRQAEAQKAARIISTIEACAV